MTVISSEDEDKIQNRTLQTEEEEVRRRIYPVTAGLKSLQTKKTYLLAFNDFLKTTVKSYDLGALLDYKSSVIESKIIGHIERLKERKLSYSAINVSYAAIIHFFELNDIDNLNTKKIKRFFPQDESDRYSTDRPYSVDEIKLILDKCDIRSRVVILLMASAGMRIGALHTDEEGRPGIRVGDLKKINEFGLYMISVYPWSKSDRYYTFCTPECAAAIDAYLFYRQKFGEEINDKSPLIREQFNIDNPFTAIAPKFLSKRTMSYLFEDLLKRSGINQLKPGQKRREVMPSHGLRKFFITECDRAKISYTVREFLSGHKLPNLDSSYVYRHRNEEDMLAEYVKAIPLLTIDPNQRLRQENQELRKDYLAELGDLREEFNEMKQWLVGLQKGNQKELVKRFWEQTADKVQDEWWESDDAKEYYASKSKSK